jgi:hypothetical protein
MMIKLIWNVKEYVAILMDANMWLVLAFSDPRF